MHEIRSCPVCNSSQWENFYQVTDHSITKEAFNLIRCRDCHLVVTSPQPESEILSRYYQSDNYISHSGSPSSLLNFAYLQARKISLRWKRNIISSQKPPGKLLDLGCGTGEFLQVMQQTGWHVSGIEPNQSARKKAEKLVNKSILESLDQPTDSFDIITLWHVLEHLPDLNTTVEKLKAILKPDGRFLIAVPNYNSHDAQYYKEFWAGYDVPRHLWHFNQKAMVLFLQKHGLVLEKIIPMKLDAFYVSILSEKYKRNFKAGITSLVSGFMTGLSSNQQAKLTGEYSSLIYIARK